MNSAIARREPGSLPISHSQVLTCNVAAGRSPPFSRAGILIDCPRKRRAPSLESVVRWPDEHCGFNDHIELINRRSIAGLDRKSFQNRSVESSKLIDIRSGTQIPLRNALFKPNLQCLFSVKAIFGKKRANSFVCWSTQKRRQNNHASPRSFVGCIGASIGQQHGFNSPSGCRRHGQTLRRRSSFEAVVELDRLSKDLLLATEGGVEARFVHAHCKHQILNGGSFIALRPEDAHGC